MLCYETRSNDLGRKATEPFLPAETVACAGLGGVEKGRGGTKTLCFMVCLRFCGNNVRK